MSMFGYTEEEIKVMTYQQLTPERWHPIDAEIVREQVLKNGYSDEYEKENVKKDGTIFPVSVRIWVHKDDEGNPAGMWRIVRDRTERKNLEEKKLKAESLYRDTLERMMEGCQVIDANWCYSYLNDVAAMQGHRSKEALLGHTMMEIYPGIESTELFSALRECMEKRVPRQMENNFIYPDGSTGWFELRIAPVPEGIFVLSLDITNRKKAEEALKQHQDNLELLVEKRTVELKETLVKMIQQEKLALIGKLAGSVSHELRNPLGIISNSIYFLNMKLPATDEKLKKHLTLIQDQSTRATKIINDLLDFARTKPGEPYNVSIHDVLKKTLVLVQKPEKIAVKIIAEPKLPKARLDPQRLQQAFLNIITNAFQAMVDGGELEIATTINGCMIEIAFKDSGVGIPDEDLPRLFEPLFSTKIHGVGLGLAIAKEIVESYKGKIEIQSTVGIGSTFTIKIPGSESNDSEGENVS